MAKKQQKPAAKSLSIASEKDAKQSKQISSLGKQTEGRIKKPKAKLIKSKTHVKNADGTVSGNKQAALLKNTKTATKKPLVLALTPDKKPVKSQQSTADLQAKKIKIPKAKANTSPSQMTQTKLQQKNAKKRAFRKKQLKDKRAGKLKKEKKLVPKVFEVPAAFDEDQFGAIVNEENIRKVTEALKTLVAKEVAERNTPSIFEDFRYLLNVSAFKIPSCPKRIVKLNLKHSIVKADDDVAIVVADLQRGGKVDYEPTIQHYDDLLREAGITNLKVVPFNQLRNECNSFETVRKFGNTYDYFLCDGRLVGQVAGFCGKIFQKPRSTFHAVRMENTKNLKREIEKSLRRTAYKQLHKGDLISIPVGNNKHSVQELAENVEHVIAQLKKLYPGGWANMRAMYLKIDIAGTSALPLYMGAGTQAPSEAPYIVGPREQRMLKLKKEANEVLTKFSLLKDAKIVKLKKTDIERKRKFKDMHEKLLNEEEDVPKMDEDKNESTKVKKMKKKENNGTATKADDDGAHDDDEAENIENYSDEDDDE